MRKKQAIDTPELAKPSSTILDAVVIGAGFAGLCMGIKLRQAGLRFRILEKAGNVGGTWRDNTYPGCACDTQSHHYSLSFATNPDWSRRYASQPEILAYLKKVARDHELLPTIHFGEHVTEAHYSDTDGLWHISTASGARYNARFLISCVGQLNHPADPDIPGLSRFKGARFHTARWDHRYNLRGKKVAVIGSGASAIQLIPPVAAQADQLHVFQRSPNWVVPRDDRTFSDTEKQRFRKFPLLARLYRYRIYWGWERSWPEFLKGSRTAQRRTREISAGIAQKVTDPTLAGKLTPDYPLGCKRILLADDFYPAMQRDNVELITQGIEKIDNKGLITDSGERYDVDCIITATGFKSHYFLKDIDLRGRNGLSLHDHWNGRPHAYLGICVPGFPNFFMSYGPNTNLGHNSIVFMIECQARFIMNAVARASADGSKAIEVRDSAMTAHLAKLDRDMERTSWVGSCSSWYKNEDGQVINNWSTTTYRYWWQTRRPNWSDFNLHS
jgi:cation diffusion facilitator CzcD-associated flavoprotein CzcO